MLDTYSVVNDDQARMQRLRSSLAVLLAFSAAALAHAAQGNEWPTKSVRIVAPYVPGGSADMLGRTIGAKLGEMLGQTVVIENRGGAAGVVGSELVSQANRDG